MKQVSRKSDHDKHVTEAVIRRFGPISRVGIYELTKIRRTTISLVVRELLAEGRILVAGRSNNPLGRKQVLLRLNEDFGFLVGLEFDEKQVVAGVLNLHPRVTFSIAEPTNLGEGREGMLRQLQAIVARVIAESDADPGRLLGIGIADPGLVDSRRGIIVTSTTIDFWSNVPLQRVFENRFGAPVVVESKTRAKAVAERALGAGERQDNLVYIDYGAGIGAGIVVDGKVLYGQNCGVGEIGHTRVDESEAPCTCGSTGCLEAIASTAALEARVRCAIAGGASTQALGLAGGDPARITTQMIFEAAAAGDNLCGDIVSTFARQLGIGIANVVNLFNPAVIILDKRLESGKELLLSQVARVVRRHTLNAFSSLLALRYGAIGEDANLLGIALCVLEKRYEIPALRPPSFLVADALGEPLTVPAASTPGSAPA